MKLVKTSLLAVGFIAGLSGAALADNCESKKECKDKKECSSKKKCDKDK
ncbi:hypothetical protein [Rubritalea marina]|nr:hypothetical protein [Rubritalea marina]